MLKKIVINFLLVLLLMGCASSPKTTVEPFPTVPADLVDTYSHLDLSQAELATLLSLKQVDDHPLYTMQYYADYEDFSATELVESRLAESISGGPQACSLFAAFADPGSMVFGRNYDWNHTAALILFAHPPDGYTSVSMVDFDHPKFRGVNSQNMAERPLDELVPLLTAINRPTDGFNEAGVAIGMAMVPSENITPDPLKPIISDRDMIREVLDHAGSVDEAISLFKKFNISSGRGIVLHYLIADQSGKSVIIEFHQGKMHILRNSQNWQIATNFNLSSVDSPQGECSRYDKLENMLSASAGSVSQEEALAYLDKVAQGHTQWSIVFGISTGDILLVMGRDIRNIYQYHIDLIEK